MLGLLVFVGSFLSVFGVTLIFPNVPPGRLVIDFFGESETSFMLAGVSGNLLLSATINGLVWGVIIGVLYSYWRGPKREERKLPVWVPGYATSRGSKKTK
jgi:hypothetical protein